MVSSVWARRTSSRSALACASRRPEMSWRAPWILLDPTRLAADRFATGPDRDAPPLRHDLEVELEWQAPPGARGDGRGDDRHRIRRVEGERLLHAQCRAVRDPVHGAGLVGQAHQVRVEIDGPGADSRQPARDRELPGGALRRARRRGAFPSLGRHRLERPRGLGRPLVRLLADRRRSWAHSGFASTVPTRGRRRRTARVVDTSWWARSVGPSYIRVIVLYASRGCRQVDSEAGT